MPLFNLPFGLQGHWALMEQWSPCKWKIKSIRRCQVQVSQAFRLMAQRLQMDLQTFLLLPRATGSSSRGAISIMTNLPAASARCYHFLNQWLPQTASSPLYAPLDCTRATFSPCKGPIQQLAFSCPCDQLARKTHEPLQTGLLLKRPEKNKRVETLTSIAEKHQGYLGT